MTTGDKEKVWDLIDKVGVHLTRALEALSGYSPYDTKSAMAYDQIFEAKKSLNELKALEASRE